MNIEEVESSDLAMKGKHRIEFHKMSTCSITSTYQWSGVPREADKYLRMAALQ
jgi:hypothetical protein